MPTGKVHQVTEKLRTGARHLDRLANHLSALEVWTRREPGARRPKLSRDEIAAAAVAICDAEGFSALSMRRLAIELDAGTMSLYHYVHTKDEVLALMCDHMMGQALVPEPLPTDWRTAIMKVANASRKMLQGHPWMLDIVDNPPFGPNSVRHVDQSLRALSSLQVDEETKLRLLFIVDEYVFGYCLMRRSNERMPDIDDGMVDYLDGLLAGGDYPDMQRLVQRLGLKRTLRTAERISADPRRFDDALARLLDSFAPRPRR